MEAPMRKPSQGWFWGLSLAGLALSTGCALGPNFRRPAVAVPESFKIEAET